MSLPASQQRTLNDLETALRASEPQLTSMYIIFGRLCAGEPVTREKLDSHRLRWLRPGSMVYAIVLVPVMFAAVITGILLGGSNRGVNTCEAGYAVGGVTPPAGHPPCSETGSETSSGPGQVAAGSSDRCAAASAVTSSGPGGAVGEVATPPLSYLTRSGSQPDLSPPVRAATAAGTPPGVC